MSSVTCPLCASSFEKGGLESHIAESHSNPKNLTSEGKTEAVHLREHFERLEDEDDSHMQSEMTAAPAMSALDDLGIKLEDFDKVEITTEAGAALTPAEAKRTLAAVENFVGFRIDRASFVINFIDWGIRSGFTEELANAGGFSVVSHNTVELQKKYITVSTLHDVINEAFNAAGTGRDFTFRRLGRYLGKSIPSIIERSDTLKKYYTEGSPMSNRFGVAPAHFLAVTSIFEYVKPYNKWSRAEREAWSAHNRSIVKPSNQANDLYLPTDLRPSPSQAVKLADEGNDDFSRRISSTSYGKGESLFDKMISGTMKPKQPRTGLGYSDE